MSNLGFCIGGGILGIPFAVMHLGIPFAIFCQLGICYLTVKSCELYLIVKDITPGKLESLYEIGYMIAGRKTIFWISGVVGIYTAGFVSMYFLVFGDIASSIIKQVMFDDKEGNILTKRSFYVFLLAAMCFPLIIRKNLGELKIASVVLFLGVLSFLVIIGGQLLFQGNTLNHDSSYKSYYITDNDLNMIKGLSIIAVSTPFHTNLFPVYNALREQTNENCMKACHQTVGALTTVYLLMAGLTMFFFGTTLDQNVLNNVIFEGKTWESMVLRIMFLLILACHVPFVFFNCKESILIMVDEFNRQSISKAL